jgi:8-oxo-dGTP pyrophosphatase MutT (NUDIX family)
VSGAPPVAASVAALAARVTALCLRLAERAHRNAPDDWLAVSVVDTPCGLARQQVAAVLAADPTQFSMVDGRLVCSDRGLDFAQRSRLLNDAAMRLRSLGLVAGWRDEQLDLRTDPGAVPVATLERAAFRPLGFTNCAVQLNAWAGNDQLWVARRSERKQIDPGMWDNLVGGMIPAGESAHDALLREAQEEAGLDLTRHSITSGRRVHERRPVPEGWQSEILYVSDVELPAGVELANRDGEVAAIECWPLANVVAAIERDLFTQESALATLDSIARRFDLATPAGLFC